MPYQQSSGFSVLETLLALSLFSISSVLIFRQQRETLHQLQYIHYKHFATKVQQSIAEQIKSCAGHGPCQQHELHKWQQYYAIHAPSLKIHYFIKEDIIEFTISWKTYTQRLVTSCYYV